MKEENLISHARLLEILDYSPDTGIFTWKINRWRGTKAGKIAGSVNSRGYRVIFIEYHMYKEHRLAWFYMSGKWPIGIDHINRIKTDNSFCNLREATSIENSRNKGIFKSNTSGFKGVSWSKKSMKWQVKARLNGKCIYIGFFDNKEDAAVAYKNFAIEHHGDFFVGDDGLRNT